MISNQYLLAWRNNSPSATPGISVLNNATSKRRFSTCSRASTERQSGSALMPRSRRMPAASSATVCSWWTARTFITDAHRTASCFASSSLFGAIIAKLTVKPRLMNRAWARRFNGLMQQSPTPQGLHRERTIQNSTELVAGAFSAPILLCPGHLCVPAPPSTKPWNQFVSRLPAYQPFCPCFLFNHLQPSNFVTPLF
jgi:hypothetical protein